MNISKSICSRDAAPLIDSFVRASCQCDLEIKTRGVWGENWIRVGTVEFPDDGLHLGRNSSSTGSYNLSVDSEDDILKVLNVSVSDKEQISKVLSEALQDGLRRSLLLPVIFDDAALKKIRGKLPSSIVVDTSSIRQGAASQLIRNCSPQIRLKIPLVVSMELENIAEQFLGLDRSSQRKALTNKQKMKLLKVQTSSQGSLRFLQRAKQIGSIIFEPMLHQHDPVRSIFSPITDEEFKAFEFRSVNRSYADRLILETAREHQKLFGYGYEVCLLTSDQNMARLALAEGIGIIYFVAREELKPFGRRLPGIQYSMLTGDLHTVGLQDVLWELATSFGAVRLSHEDRKFEVLCHPLRAPWTPSVTIDDRLDVNFPIEISGDTAAFRGTDALKGLEGAEPNNPEEVAVVPTTLVDIEFNDDDAAQADLRPATESTPARTKGNRVDNLQSLEGMGQANRGYPVSVQKVVLLLNNLVNRPMSVSLMTEVLGGKSSTTGVYLNFLAGSGLIELDENLLRLSGRGTELYESLLSGNLLRAFELFCFLPSFEKYMQFLLKKEIVDWGHAVDSPVSDVVRHGYSDIAEACRMALSIKNETFVTDWSPTISEFVALVIRVTSELEDSDGFSDSVSVIESMAKKKVHPIVCRDQLRKSVELGAIRVHYQGAIPRVEPYGPKVLAIEAIDGKLAVRRYRLQEGNFLSAEHASLRMRVEAV